MRIIGFLTTGPPVQKPHLTKKKKSKIIDRNIANYVPFVVPSLSTSSSTLSTLTSSTSSSQDSVIDVSRNTENPVLERSEIRVRRYGETRCMNPQKPKTQIKKKDAKKYKSWNHCTSTPHRSETNGIAEGAVRSVKEGTSAVLLQSSLDNEWWADSMECLCHLRNTQDLLSDGKTPYERRFGMPFNGPVIPFGAVVEYHPISAKDQSRLHQFGSNARGESGMETSWSQTLKY